VKSPRDPNKDKPTIGQQDVHPDIRCNAPGRIPESLIDAAIDGELNDDMQREIAQALSYDPVRKQELIDTSDAINALQMPISMPDFSDSVLARADRRRRFIPAAWRKRVRTGRLAIAAMLLLTLMSVATLQRIYPRLTTLASHPTPVLDIEQAMEHDTTLIAESVNERVAGLRASIAPMAELFSAPGRTDHRFDRSHQALIQTTVRSTNSNPLPSTSRYKFPSRSTSQYAGEIRFVHLGHSITAVYITNNSSVRPYGSVHPSRTLGMRSWSSHARASNIAFVQGYPTRSHADRSIEIEHPELDIPALP